MPYLGQSFGRFGKKTGHFAGRFQMPFRIGGKLAPRLVDARAFANAGQNILQRPVFWPGIKRIIDGEQRHACLCRERLELCQLPSIAPGAVLGNANPDMWGSVGQRLDHRNERRGARQEDEHQIITSRQKIGDIEEAFPLFPAQIACRQQSGQPPPALSVDRIGDDIGRAIGKDQPRACEQAKVLGLARLA